MEAFKGFSIYASNLKSFGPERQGFDEIKNVNLIVGRNNSGKSALVDLIQAATTGSAEVASSAWHGGQKARVFTVSMFGEQDLSLFPGNTSGGSIGINHHLYGQKFLGSKVEAEIFNVRNGAFISSIGVSVTPPLEGSGGYGASIANQVGRNLLQGRQFYRLAAERNIVAEPDSGNNGVALTIDAHGNGATNMIQHFINKTHLSSALVEEVLLDSLNEVFAPDAEFTRIVCQHHTSDSKWEIYLEEASKGRISLSNSGSGLKTVILVLCYIHLLPAVNSRKLDEFVFAFEELENNLHPALLRRLMRFISKKSLEHGFPVFLTTHSGVAIDLFSKDRDAQILHVIHDGTLAKVSPATTYIDQCGILDDLDLRASDLLQANGIIWVEGPSDRIYLNNWIKLISDGQLVEGVHYQCVFYGGRLLSHLSGMDVESSGDAIPLLGVNRNAAILIDSDRRKVSDELNSTKNRIIKEFNDFSGLVWVTDGREIENYIPESLLTKWLPAEVIFKKQKSRFDSFFRYLDRMQPNLGSRFETKKPILAEQLTKLCDLGDLHVDGELIARITALCERIKKWNKI